MQLTQPVLIPEFLRFGWMRLAVKLLNNMSMSKEALAEALISVRQYQDDWRKAVNLISPPLANIPEKRINMIISALIGYGLVVEVSDDRLCELTFLGHLANLLCGVELGVNPLEYTIEQRWICFYILMSKNGGLIISALNNWPLGEDLLRSDFENWSGSIISANLIFCDELSRFKSYYGKTTELGKRFVFPLLEPLREFGWIESFGNTVNYRLTSKGQRARDFIKGIDIFKDWDDWSSQNLASFFCSVEGFAPVSLTEEQLGLMIIKCLEAWPPLLDARNDIQEHETPLMILYMYLQAELLKSDSGPHFVEMASVELAINKIKAGPGMLYLSNSSSMSDSPNIRWSEDIFELQLTPKEPRGDGQGMKGRVGYVSGSKQNRKWWIEYVRRLLLSCDVGHPLFWPLGGVAYQLSHLSYQVANKPKEKLKSKTNIGCSPFWSNKDHRFYVNLTAFALSCIVSRITMFEGASFFSARKTLQAWLDGDVEHVALWNSNFNERSNDYYSEAFGFIVDFLNADTDADLDTLLGVGAITSSILLDIQYEYLWSPVDMLNCFELCIAKEQGDRLFADAFFDYFRLHDEKRRYLSTARWNISREHIQNPSDIQVWEPYARKGIPVDGFSEVCLIVNNEKFDEDAFGNLDPYVVELTAEGEFFSYSEARARFRHSCDHLSKYLLLHVRDRLADNNVKGGDSIESFVSTRWRFLSLECSGVNSDLEDDFQRPLNIFSDDHISCPVFIKQRGYARNNRIREKIDAGLMSAIHQTHWVLVESRYGGNLPYEQVLSVWASLEQLLVGGRSVSKHDVVLSLSGPSALSYCFYKMVWLSCAFRKAIFKYMLSSDVSDVFVNVAKVFIDESIVEQARGSKDLACLHTLLKPLDDICHWRNFINFITIFASTDRECVLTSLSNDEPWLIGEISIAITGFDDLLHLNGKSSKPTEASKKKRPEGRTFVHDYGLWVSCFFTQFYDIRNAIAHDGWSFTLGKDDFVRQILDKMIELFEPVILDLEQGFTPESDVSKLLAKWQLNFELLCSGEELPKYLKDPLELAKFFRPFAHEL